LSKKTDSDLFCFLPRPPCAAAARGRSRRLLRSLATPIPLQLFSLALRSPSSSSLPLPLPHSSASLASLPAPFARPSRTLLTSLIPLHPLLSSLHPSLFRIPAKHPHHHRRKLPVLALQRLCNPSRLRRRVGATSGRRRTATAPLLAPLPRASLSSLNIHVLQLVKSCAGAGSALKRGE
jgi:hypothetical protein